MRTSARAPLVLLVLAAIALAVDGPVAEALEGRALAATLRTALAVAAVAVAAVSLAALRVRSAGRLAAFGVGFLVEEVVLFLLAEPWTPLWWTGQVAGAVGAGAIAWAAWTTLAADERRRQEAAFGRLRRDLVNVAAHEVATPLTPIKIQSVLLRRAVEAGDREAALRALGVLERNVEKLGEAGRAVQARTGEVRP